MTTRRTIQYATFDQVNPLILSGAQSKTPAGKVCSVYCPTELRVDILVTAANVNGGAITLLLQQSPGSGADNTTAIWIDAKSITIPGNVSSDTYFTITLQTSVAGDEQYLPLADAIRLVATLSSGQSVTIKKVHVLS